ncbi:potassium-transporting ATPase A chain [Striga asiatica]|uniref:Potassium-transporting ATPase A chain n=1 Tax=Striga asiatica TaxID=4170 RepID=A0A5A7PIR6_STRAF|nr:potassium-transporting ATPase A chain [Striga asiatica]
MAALIPLRDRPSGVEIQKERRRTMKVEMVGFGGMRGSDCLPGTFKGERTVRGEFPNGREGGAVGGEDGNRVNHVGRKKDLKERDVPPSSVPNLTGKEIRAGLKESITWLYLTVKRLLF